MKRYFTENVVEPLRRSPTQEDWRWALLMVPFAAVALPVALASGLVDPSWPRWWEVLVMPPLLLAHPVLIEESFYRGLLLPRSLDDASPGRRAMAVAASTALFVAVHPLIHVLFFEGRNLFATPWFASIVALLGLTCSVQYLKTRSLRVPMLTHWLTVVGWNLFLGHDVSGLG